MAGLATKRRYTFDAGAAFTKALNIPSAAGSPAGVTNFELWIDTTAGKLAFRLAGATILVPLPGDIPAAGLTEEQAEDYVAAMFTGADMAAGDITWAYTDNAGAAGTIKGTIKNNAIITALIANSAVTYAKIQNVSATARILGRTTAGAGVIEELDAAAVKTMLAIVAANISDFVTNARTSISILDTATLDLSYNNVTGVLSGAVLDSPTVGGQTAANIQTAVIAAISNGAGAAYDTLIEIQNLLAADDTADALIVTAMGIRSRFFAMDVPSGATFGDIPHALALGQMGDFAARVFVKATGVEEEYDVTPTTVNNVRVTDETGANIPAGRRIFLVAGA